MEREENEILETFISGLKKVQISDSTLQIIRSKLRYCTIKQNDVLLEPGKICTHAYFVVKGGFVCRFINSETGSAKTINFYLNDLHPFMACVDSFFFQTPTQCELRAVADSQVLSLPKSVIDQLSEEDIHCRTMYNSLVKTAITEENDLKLKLISYSSEDLYHYIQQHFPSVIQQVPSKYIAEFMGISAEWLSKLKAKKRNSSSTT